MRTVVVVVPRVAAVAVVSGEGWAVVAAVVAVAVAAI